MTAELVTRWQAALRRGVAAPQSGGHVTAAVDPDRVSAALLAAIRGGVVILMSTGDSGHRAAAPDTMLDHLGTTG